MLCQNCGENEANVKYTHIINGIKKEMALCDKCSGELGIGTLDFNIPINFSSFLGEFLNNYDQSNFLPKVLKCDTCNMTYDEFISTGKFGCSNCYLAFAPKIDVVLKNLHGNTMHTGKRIDIELNNKVENINKKQEHTHAQNNELTKKQLKIKELKDNLKKAIKEERYEDAAKLRDEINLLEI